MPLGYLCPGARESHSQRAMFQWISGIIESGGYWGLLFLAFIENVFPPIPSELIMPLGGSLVRAGKMNFLAVLLAATVGSTLGSLPLYYLGKIVGHRRLKGYADKYGAWLSIDGKDLDKAKSVFDRHQALAVFGCRMIPGLRSIIAVPAGIEKMALVPFLICTFAGSGLWTLFLVSASWILGPAFGAVDKFLGPLSWVVLGACVAFIVWRAWKKKRPSKPH